MSGNATLAPDLATTSTRLSEIEAREPSRRSSKLEWIALHSLGIAMGLLFLLPFVFIFLTSVMSDEQTLTRDLWPQTWEWHNFQQTWETPGFATWWRNTIAYAVAGTCLTMLSLSLIHI